MTELEKRFFEALAAAMLLYEYHVFKEDSSAYQRDWERIQMAYDMGLKPGHSVVVHKAGGMHVFTIYEPGAQTKIADQVSMVQAKRALHQALMDAYQNK